MPVSHAVSALTQKHASIQGEILSLEHQLNDLNEKLNALEISIRIFEPEYKLQEIRAKRKVQRLSGLTKGEIPKLVGDYVRLADKDFIVNDLVDYIFNLKPELCHSTQAAIKQNVSHALKKLAQKNLIIQVGKESGAGNAIIWRALP